MSTRSGRADDLRRTASQSEPAEAPRLASRTEADEAARRVVLAHYAWVARAARRQARVTEACALAEIGGDDHAPETVNAEPLPESSSPALEPTPSPWRAALACCLEQIAPMIHRRPAQDPPRAGQLSGLS